MSRSFHTNKVVCQSCKHENLIDSPINPNGQPLQDWFCSQCDQKLFSVSFKKPIHPDTLPITCSQCKLKNKLNFGPSDISKQFAKWNCSSCKTELVKLRIQRSKTTNPWDVVQNTIRAKSREVQNNPRAEVIGNFVRNNWMILGTITICFLVWININGGGSQSLDNSSGNGSIGFKGTVDERTEVAKQEFLKYSQSDRVQIQRFLKNNFGYRSTIDGLWGQETAESFLRAANRYARDKSLYSTNNVNTVYAAALNRKSNSAQTQQSTSLRNNPQNNLGLTNEQTATFNYLNNLCWHSTTGPEALAKCSRNSYCQAKFGRNCDVERPQINCVIVEHPFQATSRALNTGINYPDRIVCE